MTDHNIGTRDEWLAARLDLLQAERELTHLSDELAWRRQELPWVRIDKAYQFEADEGSASLADLFRGRTQLLIYHFMLHVRAGIHRGRARPARRSRTVSTAASCTWPTMT